MCVLFLAACATTVLFSGADYWVFFGLAVPGGLTLAAVRRRERLEALRLSIRMPAPPPSLQEEPAEQRTMNDEAMARGGGITNRKRIILQSSGLAMFLAGTLVWAIKFSALFMKAVESIFRVSFQWGDLVVAVAGLAVGVIGVVLLKVGEEPEDSLSLRI